MLPPATVIVVDVPEHILALALVVNVGALFTVTATVLLPVHPPDPVPTTVYVVLAVGAAFTVVPVDILSPVVGLHT